jgi:hypothetical protein
VLISSLKCNYISLSLYLWGQEMVDDGNCQFRALSSECYGTQRWHVAIRNRVVDHMLRNSDDFEIYFADRRAFDSYLSSMRETGTWGDELTLRAAVKALSLIYSTYFF